MSQVRSVILAVAIGLFVPALAFAQGTITGTVRDTSGAVLPGVTVEASSPALIENARTGVTDGAGQYRMVDLRPGVYTVTFALSGFSTVEREGIELAGAFTATVNAELRVGELSETVTVTGEAPIVDVQSVTKQQVISSEVIDTLPTGKSSNALVVLIPGINMVVNNGSGARSQDVGGALGEAQARYTAHGSRLGDGSVAINGVNYSAGNGGTADGGQNVRAMQEMVVDTAGVDVSASVGGPRLNYIPKEGGNTFSGSVYFSGAHPSWQSNNVDGGLQARGLRSGTSLKSLYDVAPTLGGPIRQGRVWFFGSFRRSVAASYLAGRYFNLNAGNPNSWTYAPDLGRQVSVDPMSYWSGGRITWQAAANHKVSFGLNENGSCRCPNVSGTTSPEAATDLRWDPLRDYMIDYSAPLTNRLLLQVGVLSHRVIQYLGPNEFATRLIGVTETQPVSGAGAASSYRGAATFITGPLPSTYINTSVAYVTGTHAAKVGFQIGSTKAANSTFQLQPLQYTFTSGVPTAFTANLWPQAGEEGTTNLHTDADLGIFVQDRWTVGRLSVTGGLRFDYLKTSAGEVTLGATALMPNRRVTFPKTPLLSQYDFSPRMGMAFDVFGNGKTALRASLNRYVQGWGSRNANISPDPASRYVMTASRAWTDANGNFVPDCDPLNVNLQDSRATGGDLCGALSGAARNFGNAANLGSQVDPGLLTGRGGRPFNWEFSVGGQQQLMRGVSVDIAYVRRWYGAFTVTDNLALSAADFNTFNVVAPIDARLPNGGGYVITDLVDIARASARVAPDNFITSASDYGKQIEHWNGVDMGASVRPGGGLLFQGGVSTGRTSTDNCEIVAKVPEMLAAGSPRSYCHVDTNFLTQVKLTGSYTVPRVDLQLGVTVQSLPGVALVTNYAARSGTTATGGYVFTNNVQNVTVNLFRPGTLYGERSNQVDLRFGKLLRFGGTRTSLSVDMYNAFNGNAVLAENQAYAAFRSPILVLAGRIVKFTAQFDF